MTREEVKKILDQQLELLAEQSKVNKKDVQKLTALTDSMAYFLKEYYAFW